MKKLTTIKILILFFIPLLSFAQWTNAGSNLYTTDNVIIDRTTPKFSWLELDVNGTIGGKGLDLYTESGSGWSNQITWNGPLGRRHIIADNYGNDRLLIWPGIGGGAEKIVEIHGKLAIGSGGYTNVPTNVGGADVSSYSLFVERGILTDELRVRTGWADYVFDEGYTLIPLVEVENFIETNGHLPNVPSAEVVEAEGINVGEMTKIQQEKIEELTLYIIDQNKRIEKLEALCEKLLNQIETANNTKK
ncbi:hypothetical protein [Kordia sp.]|uniref:hypothetical protein n=1 Tax=Kordia sp. TaxID=1965332 RepID=UPI003D2E0027